MITRANLTVNNQELRRENAAQKEKIEQLEANCDSAQGVLRARIEQLDATNFELRKALESIGDNITVKDSEALQRTAQQCVALERDLVAEREARLAAVAEIRRMEIEELHREAVILHRALGLSEKFAGAIERLTNEGRKL